MIHAQYETQAFLILMSEEHHKYLQRNRKIIVVIAATYKQTNFHHL